MIRTLLAAVAVALIVSASWATDFKPAVVFDKASSRPAW